MGEKVETEEQWDRRLFGRNTAGMTVALITCISAEAVAEYKLATILRWSEPDLARLAVFTERANQPIAYRSAAPLRLDVLDESVSLLGVTSPICGTFCEVGDLEELEDRAAEQVKRATATQAAIAADASLAAAERERLRIEGREMLKGRPGVIVNEGEPTP